jgi:hypothetical protein
VPVEQTGQTVSDDMRRFRTQWIGVRP